MDEGDVTKFIDAIKQFDTMTHLVCLVAQSRLRMLLLPPVFVVADCIELPWI